MTKKKGISIGKSALSGIVIFWSVVAFAGEGRWIYFSTNGLGDTFYYDKESITSYDNSIIKIWYKIIMAPNSESPVREAIFLDEYNCRKREWRSIKGNYYYKSGEAKYDNQIGSWENIEPETWRESLFNVLCKRK